MTNLQLEKNRTAGQVSDDRWRGSLGLRETESLPVYLDRAQEQARPARVPQSAILALIGRACVRAAVKVDAGVARIEDGLTLACVRTARVLGACVYLSLAGAVACRELIRQMPDWADRLKDAGVEAWKMASE